MLMLDTEYLHFGFMIYLNKCLYHFNLYLYSSGYNYSKLGKLKYNKNMGCTILIRHQCQCVIQEILIKNYYQI